MRVTLAPSRTTVTESGFVASHFGELRPGEARRRRELQVAIRQIGGDPLLVLVERVGARRVVVPERHGLRNPLLRKVRRVLVGRLPRTMRRLVMHHQEERLVPRTFLDEINRQVRDDIGGVLPV